MNYGPLSETIEWGTPNRHTIFLLHKLRELGCLDLCIGLNISPLGEIISGYQDEFSFSYDQG